MSPYSCCNNNFKWQSIKSALWVLQRHLQQIYKLVYTFIYVYVVCKHGYVVDIKAGNSCCCNMACHNDRVIVSLKVWKLKWAFLVLYFSNFFACYWVCKDLWIPKFRDWELDFRYIEIFSMHVKNVLKIFEISAF